MPNLQTCVTGKVNPVGVSKLTNDEFRERQVFRPEAHYYTLGLYMNLEELKILAESYHRVTTDIKWEDHLCFNIGGKMFLITSLSNIPTTASIKVSDDDFIKLIEKPGITPAPYLARYKWIHLEDITLLTTDQWQTYSEKAYNLISAKLPKKTRLELGI